MSTDFTCQGCGQSIVGRYVRALDKSFHFSCFKCRDCSCPVSTKFFPIVEDSGDEHPLCEKDYFARQGLLCATCGEALRGEYLQALGKKYHVEHFRCAVCSVVFGPSGIFYEHDGKAYCDYHFAQDFASRCGGCLMPILKQCVVVTRSGDEERWHVECFTIYRAWNISLNSEDGKPNGQNNKLEPSSPPANHQSMPSASDASLYHTSDDTKDHESMRQLQLDLEEKVSRIRDALSVFEESAATCITNLLLCVSKNIFTDGVDEAASFILHVQVLFSAIDDIGRLLIQHGDNCGLDHSKEPKWLCQKIVGFISLLTQTRVSADNYSAVTQDFIVLITSLAHLLKDLIRFALSGAFRLERHHRQLSAISNFSETLMQLAGQGNEVFLNLDDTVKIQNCVMCNKEIEDSCILGLSVAETGNSNLESRWHMGCLNCMVCLAPIAIEGPNATVADVHGEKNGLICSKCTPGSDCTTIWRLRPVTALEQYSYLMRVALKGLLSQLGITLDGSIYSLQTRVFKTTEVDVDKEFVSQVSNAVPNETVEDKTILQEGDSRTLLLTNPSSAPINEEGIVHAVPVVTGELESPVPGARCGQIIWFSDLSGLQYSLLQHFAVKELEKLLRWGKADICSLIDREKKSGVWSKLKVSLLKKGKQKEGTFGVPLDILVDRTGVESSLGASPGQILIPWFVDICVGTLLSSDLGNEGLFRKSGNIRRLNQARELFDTNPLAGAQAVRNDTPEQNAALLKKFLRELPEPLLTFRLFNLFLEANNLNNDAKRRNLLRYAVCLLPKVNRDLIEVVMILLQRVAQREGKMDLHNLAIVIMPNFLLSPLKQQIETTSCVNVVYWLLLWQEDYWTVPESIADMLRDERQGIQNSVKRPGSMLLPRDNMVCLVRDTMHTSSSALFEEGGVVTQASGTQENYL